MKENKISIKVCGSVGSGKSTIMQEIKKSLKDLGLDVDIIYGAYDNVSKTEMSQDLKVKALKDKNTKIEIYEQPIHRDGIHG